MAQQDTARESEIKTGDERSIETSLGSKWKEFASKTTLHGVSRVQDKNRNLVSRSFWCISVLAMLCVTIYILSCLVLLYREYPIRSVWSLRRETRTKMPLITLCLSSSFDSRKINSSAASRKFFSNHLNINERDPEVENIIDRPLSETFYTYGFSKEELMLKYTVRDSRGTHDMTDSVTRYVHMQHGMICFATGDSALHYTQSQLLSQISYDTRIRVILKQSEYQWGIHKASDFFGSDVLLLLGERGDTEDSQKPLMITPRTATYVLFSRKEYHFLPQPYASFGDGATCIDNGEKRLRMFTLYSKSNCVQELLQNISADTCGCVMEGYPPWFQDRNMSECSYRQYLTCYKHLKTRHSDTLEAGCPPRCDTSLIEYTHSTSPFTDTHKKGKIASIYGDDYVDLVLQVKTTNVEVLRHEPEITWGSIFATLGGFMGLFLGASVLTVAEGLEFLLTAMKMIVINLIRGRR